MKAIGEDYILCYEKNVAEKNGMRPSHVRGHYIKFPEVGDVYDFRGAEDQVLVCGRPYDTLANGTSCPHDVRGKMIRVTKVHRGDEREFAAIEYEEAEQSA